MTEALIQRGEIGGSYTVDLSLNYYSQWLLDICGVYSKEVWEDIWTRNGRESFRHYQSMNVTMPAYLSMIRKFHSNTLMRPEFFEIRESKAIGLMIRVVKPVLQFPPGTVRLEYTIGTRGNGIDQPFWPKDLSREIVRSDAR